MNITKQIRLADVVFLCFDVKEISTFQNLKEYFYKEIKINVPNYKTKILLGMKCDNGEMNFYNEIKEFVAQENLFYAETSIYYDDNYVYKMFCMENFFDENDKMVFAEKIGYNKEESSFFLRAGVNVIIDLAVSLVTNIQSKSLCSEAVTTTNIGKTVTITDFSVSNSYCRCLK
jgi:GTPase SAR1 family protein